MDPIDAVISWVDGYDPVYQQKLARFCEEQGFNQARVLEPTRIQQCNEIHYCMHALRCFAPWIRTIYIITNEQTPKTVLELQDTAFGNKIKIINQSDLLAHCGVKSSVFNSLSIEWALWRIPGLSTRFIYLNDDFFIIRPVTPDDFFWDQGVVLRGEWKVQADKKWRYQLQQYGNRWFGLPKPRLKINPHRAWQEQSARLAGWTRTFYLLPHAPFPLLKTTFETAYEAHPDLFTFHAGYPFRHADQYSCVPWMTHVDISHQRVIYDKKPRTIMVNGESHSFRKIQSRLTKAHQDKQVLFVCMQSMDQASEKVRHYMLHWLEQHIATQSIFLPA